MSELAFEYLLVALENVARGTAVNPPTRYIPLEGQITPMSARYRPPESRGHLAEHTRSKTTRKWSEWEGEGPLDVFLLPLFLNMILKGGVTAPSTPSGATLARLWEFEPTMTSDDLKSGTIYWGDPNTQAFQTAYNMVEEFGISADATGEDGATMSLSGRGRALAKTAPSSVPAQLNAPLIVPADMQLWMDTSSAIATTEITGRFLSAEFSLSTGVSFKWGATGPLGNRNFVRTGRGKRHAELTLAFELLDMAQYDLFGDNDGDTVAKIRWRLNGPEIETGFRHFVEVDLYGTFDAPSWGDHEGTNRTIELTAFSEYDITEGWDFAMRVQNNRTTL